MRTTVIGSGPVGMTAALLLARQGHDVTLVDRDPGPTPSRPWKRVGVMQFHLPHAFRAQCRALLQARLPDLYDALLAAGVEDAGDVLHARRSTFETVMWSHTSAEPRVHRVCAHVTGIDVANGVAQGVVLDDGQHTACDLVIDASGRSGRPSAAHRPAGTNTDAGVAYAARQYQLLPGAQPGPTNGGPGIVHELDGFVAMLFVHDAGTFTVLFVHSKDDDLADLRDPWTFAAAIRMLPDIAAWTEPGRSEPIDRIRSGAGIFNGYRGQSATVRNLLAIGDAVCTTNPMGARGVALGLASAAALADIVAHTPVDRWGRELDAWCLTNQKIWHDDHVVTDAALLAQWKGEPIDVDGPIPWMLIAAAAREHHPEWLASLGPFFAMHAPPGSLDPLRSEVRAMLRTGWRPAPPPGPTRDQLVGAISTRLAV